MIQNGKPRSIVVRRSLAIGDAVAATVVVDKLYELGFSVTYQTHPVSHQILRCHSRIAHVTDPSMPCHINLDGAYENDKRKKERHFYEMFMEKASQQMAQYGVRLPAAQNCRPTLRLPKIYRDKLLPQFEKYPKPWITICPRSTTYTTRQIHEDVWKPACDKMIGTKFWLGLMPPPQGVIDLKCRQIEMVMLALAASDLLVTVDTGPMHIAAAIGTPVVAIYQSSNPELHLSDQVDFVTVRPPLDCLGCMENVCPIVKWSPPCQKVDPGLISDTVNRKVGSVNENHVSAIIPIYRPDNAMLNRCLQSVIPQVSEVIVTRERNGIVPQGTMSHPKIRHVVKNADGIGFGRNVNFGVRHSNGKYLLILNDDVVLAPDAVKRLLEVMVPSVGIVGHLTRYPDGTIYHAGKPRAKDGGIGFPHIDLRQKEPTIKIPVEMENTNGASILVRRKAFYDIGGFDERFKFYAEDDDIAMRMRLYGWKIWYTPHATGVHWEHQETRKMPDMRRIMAESNALFGRLWGPYFTHNRNNPEGKGNFDYLKK